MQSGVLQLGSAAWPLAKGEGPRAHLEAINFNPPFPEPPIVLTFLAGFRASNETDLRVSVEPVNITANNFFVKIGTRIRVARLPTLPSLPLARHVARLGGTGV